MKFLWAISLVLAVLLHSCGGGESSSNGNSKANSNSTELKQAPGGVYYGGVLKHNEEQFFKSLYPLNITEVAGSRIVNQMYEGLVLLDQGDLKVVPGLAEKWEVNEDATVFTFHLRKGVKFHDNECFANGKGREVTAKDVEWCFNQLATADVNNQGFHFFKDRIAGFKDHYEATANGQTPATGVSGVKVIDDYTVSITLVDPFGSFLHLMALPFTFIYPHEAFEKYGKDMRINVVGTGPFTLKVLKEDEVVFMKKNESYWGKDKNGNQLPYLDGIKYSFIKEKQAELLEFQKGNLDIVYRPPLEMMGDIVDANDKVIGDYKNFNIQIAPEFATQYYGFLNTNERFKNKKLRQAFNYAIDRQKLAKFTLKNTGVPGEFGMVPPGFKGYKYDQVKGYTYDPDKARQLMKEAGYPNGDGFEPLVLQLNAGGGRNVNVAEAVVKMLKDNLSIDVTLKQMPWAQHLEIIETGNAEFWRLGWIADYPDPENFLNLYLSKHIPTDPNGKAYINSFRYNNPEFDEKMEKALKTADENERYNLYAQAEQIAMDDAAVLILYYDKIYRLLQKKVANCPKNPMEYRNMRDVYFKPESI